MDAIVRKSWVLAIAVGLFSVAPVLALDPVGGPNADSGASRRPSLSDDGRRIAFESLARLTPDDNDHRMDVYVVDLPTGTPRRLPRAESSAGAAGVVLSGDGHAAAYHVVEAEGKPNVPPLIVVLLQDLEHSHARRVPPAWYGLKADGEALFPALGRTGRLVAFSSNAGGLVVNRENPVREIFLYEADADRVRLISRNGRGAPANRPSAEVKMSADGRYIGFLSAATNLNPVLPANSLSFHLYVADRSSGTMSRVDTIERGIDPSEWIPGRFDMSDNGRDILFEARRRKPGKPVDSLETNDLFLFEMSSGTVTRLTTGIFAGHSHSPSLSGNGRWMAFVLAGTRSDKGGLVVYDRHRQLWRRLVNGQVANPCISGDGRRIAFESADPKVTGDKLKISRVYVVDNPSFEEISVHAGD